MYTVMYVYVIVYCKDVIVLKKLICYHYMSERERAEEDNYGL